MRGMGTSRRLFALVATFAVAFGALWPLVSAAKPGPRIPSFICTQSGFQHPSTPADVDNDNFHCPLCVVSMDSALPGMPAQLVAHVPSDVALATSFRSCVDFAFFAQPPPSRAPPHA
jgi:hypothetical protein